MARRLLIIQPSHYQSKADRSVSKIRRRPVVSLTLPYLAALTPRDWAVTLVDEQLQDIDFDAPADVVAITTWTLMSLRAYDIGDAFRRRGVPVILGGPHMYFHADEALRHCDAVGIGEGETIWSRMLGDAAAGRLLPIYRGEPLEDLSGLPTPRYELLDMRRYGPFRTFTVQSSRGCPFHCEFCSERFYLGEAYRLRPVGEVVEEIKRCRTKSLFFADSNFGGKRNRAMELMEALIPLNLRWSALWSSYLCNDDEFMDLARRSGLLHLNIGIESIDADTLTTMKKRFNKVSTYADMVANLRRRGISFSLNFIFGWDDESVNAFRATLDFLQEHKVPVAYFNVLKPEKGTPLFDRMLAENRILDAEEIGRWPGQVCSIKPTSCSAEELERHVSEMYREFYSLRSIVTRLPVPWTKANIASWVVNFSQRRMARPRARGGNFDGF